MGIVENLLHRDLRVVTHCDIAVLWLELVGSAGWIERRA
jgi:hypothetical protein